jgi:hypothetical protein
VRSPTVELHDSEINWVACFKLSGFLSRHVNDFCSKFERWFHTALTGGSEAAVEGRSMS